MNKVKQVTAWETTDGQSFDTRALAEDGQLKIELKDFCDRHSIGTIDGVTNAEIAADLFEWQVDLLSILKGEES